LRATRLLKYLIVIGLLSAPLMFQMIHQALAPDIIKNPNQIDDVGAIQTGSNETTMALISGTVTRDGYPMLWKNRDRREFPNQEAVLFNDGIYPYIGLVNAGATDEVWGGVNSAGFGIANANAYNLIDSVAGPDDDGLIMKRALQICGTVEDFQALLDSTSVIGRRRTCNYGVIDAYGGAALFECAAVTYARFDAADTAEAPDGLCVRANFAYSGNDTGSAGRSRHDRVYALLMSAIENNALTSAYVLKNVAPDLASWDFDPYPLPFEGVYPDSSWPHGYISIYAAINRNITPFGIVVQGVAPGDTSALTTLWAGLGQPVSTIPVPLWIRAGSIPREVDGNPTALICDIANRIAQRLINPLVYEGALDTYQLLDGRGGGLFTITRPAMDSIFQTTEELLRQWQQELPDSNAMAEAAQWAARFACERMQSWSGRSLFRVPADYNLLQEAVNAADHGDTVLVTRGVYPGPLEFRGRNIVIASEFIFSRDPTDIDSTILDGARNGRSVVVFSLSETSRAELIGFTIRNGLSGWGGGVYVNAASPILRYNIIRNNQANRNGGGIYCTQNARPKFDHIVLFGNIAQLGGALYSFNNARAEIVNSIIWNNTPTALPETLLVTYSNVQGGYTGTGNINRNPLFVNPDSSDFHLQWTNFPVDDSTRSPCIDAGAPNFPLDLDSTRTDIGVHFFHQGSPPHIAADAAEITLNDVPLNTYQTTEIYLTNLGERELRVQTQSIRYIEGPPFIYISRGGGAFNLTSGDTHSTEITFCPLLRANYRVIYSVESNDIYRTPFEVVITGNGIILSDISISDLPSAFGMNRIFPTPCNNSVNIMLDVPQAAFVSLRILDVGGREIERMFEGSSPAGQKRFDLSVQNYAAGMYFAEFQTPQKTFLGKIIVVK